MIADQIDWAEAPIEHVIAAAALVVQIPRFLNAIEPAAEQRVVGALRASRDVVGIAEDEGRRVGIDTVVVALGGS